MNILIVNGHPDPRPERFCSALCDAYARGANLAGWDTRRVDVCKDVFPPTEFAEDLESLDVPTKYGKVFDKLRWADHLVFVFPLWLDAPPTPLQKFFSHAGECFSKPSKTRLRFAQQNIEEKPCRFIITMALPALFYRSLFSQCALGSTKANAHSLSRIRCVEPTLIGSVGHLSPEQRERWLQNVQDLGVRRFGG